MKEKLELSKAYFTLNLNKDEASYLEEVLNKMRNKLSKTSQNIEHNSIRDIFNNYSKEKRMLEAYDKFYKTFISPPKSKNQLKLSLDISQKNKNVSFVPILPFLVETYAIEHQYSNKLVSIANIGDTNHNVNFYKGKGLNWGFSSAKRLFRQIKTYIDYEINNKSNNKSNNKFKNINIVNKFNEEMIKFYKKNKFEYKKEEQYGGQFEDEYEESENTNYKQKGGGIENKHFGSKIKLDTKKMNLLIVGGGPVGMYFINLFINEKTKYLLDYINIILIENRVESDKNSNIIKINDIKIDEYQYRKNFSRNQVLFIQAYGIRNKLSEEVIKQFKTQWRQHIFVPLKLKWKNFIYSIPTKKVEQILWDNIINHNENNPLNINIRIILTKENNEEKWNKIFSYMDVVVDATGGRSTIIRNLFNRNKKTNTKYEFSNLNRIEYPSNELENEINENKIISRLSEYGNINEDYVKHYLEFEGFKEPPSDYFDKNIAFYISKIYKRLQIEKVLHIYPKIFYTFIFIFTIEGPFKQKKFNLFDIISFFKKHPIARYVPYIDDSNIKKTTIKKPRKSISNRFSRFVHKKRKTKKKYNIYNTKISNTRISNTKKTKKTKKIQR